MRPQPNNSTFLVQSTKNSCFGTAFAIYEDAQGSYLLTNAYVIEGCGVDNLVVEGKNASLIAMGSSEDIDLALLLVEGLGCEPISLSDARVSAGMVFEVYGFRQHLHQNHLLERLDGNIKKLTTLYSNSQKIDRYELTIGTVHPLLSL